MRYILAFLAAAALAAAALDDPARPETDDPSLPGLAETLLPACEYAEALRQEADEGDAPPAEMKLLCDTADGLWRIYHKLKGEHPYELGEETADGGRLPPLRRTARRPRGRAGVVRHL